MKAVAVLLIALNLLEVVWTAEICCGVTGCFNDNPPFNQMPLPWCPATINPSYTMFTRINRNDGQPFGTSGIPPVFDAAHRTVFLAHGFQSSGATEWLHTLKDAFLDREDINVVIVGWEGGADIGLLNYLQAASNTRTTGAQTALVVENLINNGGGSDTRMWCVGHSLGSHVCGNTGSRTTLQRITGLDPAGPFFEENSDITVGLNPSNARLVDIIHTDAITLGTRRPLGHVDFYPNGGDSQPGCGIDFTGSCSHGRSHEYMTQSVRTDCFSSRQECNNWNSLPGSCSTCECGSLPCAYMGYGADYGCHLTGWYYLSVSSALPYCQN